VRRKTVSLPAWKVSLFRWLLAAFVVLGSAQLYLIFVGPLHTPDDLPVPADHEDKKAAIRSSIYNVLFEFDVQVGWISGDDRLKTVRIPEDLPMVEPYTALITQFRAMGATLLAAKANASATTMEIRVAYDGEPVLHVRLVKDPDLRRQAGKIALVIDDFGYAMSSVVRGFFELPQTITVSVLPGLDYSKRIAALANENGLEVMVHLPMEPANARYERDDYILLTDMTPVEIRKRVQRSIRAVPHAGGLNNHQGSLATADRRLVNVVMEELKKRNLYFLDSRTSKASVAYDIARKKGVSSLPNNAFLDAIQEEPFVRQQLTSLAEMAARNGFAIGIGHPHAVTLAVLRQELSKLEKRGFQFVSVAELVNQEK